MMINNRDYPIIENLTFYYCGMAENQSVKKVLIVEAHYTGGLPPATTDPHWARPPPQVISPDHTDKPLLQRIPRRENGCNLCFILFMCSGAYELNFIWRSDLVFDISTFPTWGSCFVPRDFCYCYDKMRWLKSVSTTEYTDEPHPSPAGSTHILLFIGSSCYVRK